MRRRPGSPQGGCGRSTPCQRSRGTRTCPSSPRPQCQQREGPACVAGPSACMSHSGCSDMAAAASSCVRDNSCQIVNMHEATSCAGNVPATHQVCGAYSGHHDAIAQSVDVGATATAIFSQQRHAGAARHIRTAGARQLESSPQRSAPSLAPSWAALGWAQPPAPSSPPPQPRGCLP